MKMAHVKIEPKGNGSNLLDLMRAAKDRVRKLEIKLGLRPQNGKRVVGAKKFVPFKFDASSITPCVAVKGGRFRTPNGLKWFSLKKYSGSCPMGCSTGRGYGFTFG